LPSSAPSNPSPSSPYTAYTLSYPGYGGGAGVGIGTGIGNSTNVLVGGGDGLTEKLPDISGLKEEHNKALQRIAALEEDVRDLTATMFKIVAEYDKLKEMLQKATAQRRDFGYWKEY